MFYVVARAILRLVLGIAFNIKVEGKENVPPEGGVILAANHSSMLDPLLVGCAISRPIRFMAKRELFENPFLALIVPNLGAFPVKRGKNDKGAFHQALNIVKGDQVLGMFPEGTRSSDGRLQKAYSGVAVLAEKTGACVVPVGIVGVGRGIRKSTFPPKRRHIYISFGKPIVPSEVHSRISANQDSIGLKEAITGLMMDEIKKLVAGFRNIN
ncbi:MAG: 1-acyl-sn-glycerol-3-phosphate acyltransferase [Firmicutes bacterium]|nr:1-acyl-sn-glycerol-3-phosphate acyltransferase [Bacillota bacterium]